MYNCHRKIIEMIYQEKITRILQTSIVLAVSIDWRTDQASYIHCEYLRQIFKDTGNRQSGIFFKLRGGEGLRGDQNPDEYVPFMQKYDSSESDESGVFAIRGDRTV